MRNDNHTNTVNATVTVTEQLPLHCADETSLKSLDSRVQLGPLDQVSMAYMPISVVFVHRHEAPSDQELIPLKQLHGALSRLLDYYPHLTGRVAVNTTDNTVHIEKLGAGGKLVSAHCDQPLKAFEAVSSDDKTGSQPRLIAVNLPDSGQALLPPCALTQEGLTHDPILTLQHTRFACGAVAIGLSLRHILCDAAGFFQLVGDLTELYRDLLTDVVTPTLSNPPHIISYSAGLNEMSFDEQHEALKVQPTGFELRRDVQEVAAVTDANTPPVPPVTGRLLRFSAIELSALKVEANTGNKGRELSTFSALAAHLYQSVYRARVKVSEAQGVSLKEAAHNTPRQILTSVNFRSQLGVSPRYFPNCVYCSVFSLPADQLLDAPLSSIAASLRDEIQVPDRSELQQSLRWIAAQADKSRVQVNFNYAEGGLFVSQWNKFGMYRGAVFDAPPVLVVQPFTPAHLYDGLVYIMGTEDELSQSADSVGMTIGSLDVAIALSEPVWEVLDQDEHFRCHRS